MARGEGEPDRRLASRELEHQDQGTLQASRSGILYIVSELLLETRLQSNGHRPAEFKTQKRRRQLFILAAVILAVAGVSRLKPASLTPCNCI